MLVPPLQVWVMLVFVLEELPVSSSDVTIVSDADLDEKIPPLLETMLAGIEWILDWLIG